MGPGNQYVTAAKMLAQNSEAMVSIDMPAGPSEVLVIADAGAPPAHVAADLLSQAEHGPDSQVGTLRSSPLLPVRGAAPAGARRLPCTPLRSLLLPAESTRNNATGMPTKKGIQERLYGRV